MPPCPVSLPPALALASPGEAPIPWLTCAVMVVLYLWFVVRPFVNASPVFKANVARRIGGLLVVWGLLCSLAALSVVSVVFGPTNDHYEMWLSHETHQFLGEQCSLATWVASGPSWGPWQLVFLALGGLSILGVTLGGGLIVFTWLWTNRGDVHA